MNGFSKCSTGDLSDKLPAICWVKEAEGSKGENASAWAALNNQPGEKDPLEKMGMGQKTPAYRGNWAFSSLMHMRGFPRFSIQFFF